MSDLEATRERILETAGQLFAERGFEATSVRDITDRVGTSPGSINYHFRSKEDLYIETVRYAAGSCERSSPIPTWPEGVPAEKRLEDFIRAFLGRMLRTDVPAWHRTLIMREVAQPRPGACEQFVRDFVRPTFNVLLGILRDLVPTGTSRLQLDMLGGSIVGQCLHYHHARHVIALLVGPEEFHRFDIDLLTDHVYRFSLAALKGLFPRLPQGGRA